MDYAERSNFEKTVPEKGKYLLDLLKKLQEDYSVIGNVDGLGLALRIEMTKNDRFTPDKALADKIEEEGLKGNIEVNGKKYGLVLDIGGYYKNVFTLAPPLTISYEEMDLFAQLFRALLKRCAV